MLTYFPFFSFNPELGWIFAKKSSPVLEGHQSLKNMSQSLEKIFLYMGETEGITKTGTFRYLEYVSRVPVLLECRMFQPSFFSSFQVQISLSLENHAV